MIEISFNVYSLLMSIALIIALTFGLLLFFAKQKYNKADKFLAMLMFIVCSFNATMLILDFNIYRYAPGIIWIPMSFSLALGPCFYFYVHFVTDIEHNLKLKIWPHFIPVIIEIFIFLFEVFQGLPQGKAYFQTRTFLLIDPIISFVAIASFALYSFLARLKIKNYHIWVKNNYSHFHKYNLNWLSRLSSIFLYFLTLWLGYFIIDYFLFDYQLGFHEYYPFHLTLGVISIWLSIEAFIKPDIIYSDKNIKLKKDDKSSKIEDKNLQDKARWLKGQLEKNLFYLDPELSLKTLAQELNIHPNYVSKIFNDGLKQKFSDCINAYRINAVIHKLNQTKHKKTTLLAIAFDCGFNSKTTFNRVFKKNVGKTPLQYKKDLSD